jgi:DNA-binding NarL/FixJ family response regulator
MRQCHALIFSMGRIDRESNQLRSMSSSRPASILVVDDHAIVREGISDLLARQKGLDVVGLAGTGEQAVLLTERLKPDVIVMDLVLPVLNGIDATTRIMASLPETKVIILTACTTSEHIHNAFRAGVRGYVSKAAAGSELLCAVQSVLSGEKYLGRSLAAAFESGRLDKPRTKSPLERLSAREREVMHRTVEGYSSVQIALQLSLSPKTVDTYRSRLMHKLGVSNRTNLIRFAIQYAMAPC